MLRNKRLTMNESKSVFIEEELMETDSEVYNYLE